MIFFRTLGFLARNSILAMLFTPTLLNSFAMRIASYSWSIGAKVESLARAATGIFDFCFYQVSDSSGKEQGMPKLGSVSKHE